MCRCCERPLLHRPRLYRNFRGTNAAHTVFKAAGAAEHGGLVPRINLKLVMEHIS